ncbi:hypothetical protein V8E36_007003 [Tilletia maclaganii]
MESASSSSSKLAASAAGAGGGGAAAAQRRRSSGGTTFSSPKLQAARERMQNPPDLQLDQQQQPGGKQHQHRRHPSNPASLRQLATTQAPQHPRIAIHPPPHSHGKHGSSSAASSSHSHSHSRSRSGPNTLANRSRIMTVPVWARNEPPSPFTSPTVAPLTHTLPSLTDLSPLEPPQEEENEDVSQSQAQIQQPQGTQQQQQQQQEQSKQGKAKESNSHLQRFTSRSSSSAASTSSKYKRRRWLFSRRHTPHGIHPAFTSLRPSAGARARGEASSSSSHHHLAGPSSSSAQQQQQQHRHDSDSDNDADDDGAEGPERFWSFTLPPSYRAKIKDLHSFRMSSFKASATSAGRLHAAASAQRQQQEGQGDDDDDDEYVSDLEEEEVQEGNESQAQQEQAGAGKKSKDRATPLASPPASSRNTTTPSSPPIAPDGRRTPVADLSLSMTSAASSSHQTARPSAAAAMARKLSHNHSHSKDSSAKLSSKSTAGPKSPIRLSRASTFRKRTPSIKSDHTRSSSSSLRKKKKAAAAAAKRQNFGRREDGEDGEGGKERDGSSESSEDSDYVRERRASGDGTGGTGLPRGAAAAELDQNPLMSWMRRRDSSRSGPGGAGSGSASAAGTIKSKSAGLRGLSGSSFQAGSAKGEGSETRFPVSVSPAPLSPALSDKQHWLPVPGGDGSKVSASGTPSADLAQLPSPMEAAHYMEPKQKQHELQLRLPSRSSCANGGGAQQQKGERTTAADEDGEATTDDGRTARGDHDENGNKVPQEHSSQHEDDEKKKIKANADRNGTWDAGFAAGLEFSRHQPRTPGWASPWKPVEPSTAGYPFGVFNNGGAFGGGGGGGKGVDFYSGHQIHDHGGLDLEKLGTLLGQHPPAGSRRRMAGASGISGVDGGGDGSKRKSALSQFRTFLLLNPFAPFFFRMINLTFTSATLAIAILIHKSLRSIGAGGLVGSSPILGIIFAPLTLAHVFSQIYMEYFGRPIGLWSVRSKLYYTLIELVFVCFWSAELALAFDNLTTSPLECCCGASKLFRAEEAESALTENPGTVSYICRLQGSLAGLSFVSLLAYLIVLAVSLFRIFERVNRSTTTA